MFYLYFQDVQNLACPMCSDISARQSEVYSERQPSYPSFGLGNAFAFKLKLTGRDGKERNHRFNCGRLHSR